MDNAAWPEWAQKMREMYLAGGASMFLLHGNVTDVIGCGGEDDYAAEPLADVLARRLFGGYDLVLHYDVGRGLRPYAADDPQRFTKMNSLIARLLGDASALPREVTPCLRTIDRLVSLLLVGEENRTHRTAVIFDYADFICPASDQPGEHLATFLNWARSPVIRKVNIIFVLMTESLSRLNPALVQSGHTQEIAIPMPSQGDRKQFIIRRFPTQAPDAERLSVMTAGLTLNNVDNLLRQLAFDRPQQKQETRVATESGEGAATSRSIASEALTEIKKGLMAAQCPGLLEFMEPKLDLSMVAGHVAAKERLVNDAKLIRDGRLDAVPMGYILCGPVGVGKTFLALCYAGEAGIPCVTIRNFRSKYVGETEANLERILFVIRELGPIAILIDEADAAVGNRSASGDSGTSARVFAQLASQMGDTRYRGKLIWFMMTCRPDLLPIDLKRQGRCEEHIPLFYPQTPEELRAMFLSMARKSKLELTDAMLPDLSKVPPMSGADIEGLLMRVHRESLLRQRPIDAALLQETLGQFRSVKNAQHELQVLAAVMECTDLRYLPESLRRTVENPLAYDALVNRFRELKRLDDVGAGE
ncbi:MAG TPA: AAA family ATPase [Candidatus Hydrogenedentes bacterium]|nr:AAA family ATPase [Hyphomonadaceae bacterium]HPG70333.1 AAA family ATPase [Candidatus Hydrogenedentota bacterium]